MEAEDINSRVNTWDLTDTVCLGLGIFLIAVGIVLFFIYRYAYFGDSIPVPPTGWGCFLFFCIPGLSLFVIPLNWSLKATVAVASVGIILNVWVGDYSTKQIRIELERTTKEVQEALYPNKFKVRTDIQNIESEDHNKWNYQTPLISPTQFKFGKNIKFPVYPLIAKSRNMRLRLTINNQSKYPANMVPVAFFIDEGAFKERIEKISDVIKEWFPYSALREPSPLKTKKGKLKGVMFMIDQVKPKDKLFLFYLPLTLTKETGRFAITIQNNIYVFEIRDYQAEQLKVRDNKK